MCLSLFAANTSFVAFITARLEFLCAISPLRSTVFFVAPSPPSPFTRHIDGGRTSSLEPHTVSVRILDTRRAGAGAAGAEGRRGGGNSGALALRLEACGLGPVNVMGRGASVFVRDTGGAEIVIAAGDSRAARAGGLHRMFGVLPTLLAAGGDPRRGNGDRQRRAQRPVAAAPPRLRSGAGTGWRPGGPEEGQRVAAAEAATALVATALEYTGTYGGAGRSAARGGRGLQEDEVECDALCMFSRDNRCVADPECGSGKVGCNAENSLFCRYCGDGPVYEPCNDGSPTPAPVPTPSPTVDPDRTACDEDTACFENLSGRITPCFDDPSCLGTVDLLGCNAFGTQSCRFCNSAGVSSDWEYDCPFTPGTSCF